MINCFQQHDIIYIMLNMRNVLNKLLSLTCMKNIFKMNK